MKTCLGILLVVGLMVLTVAVAGWWHFRGSIFEEERKIAVAHVEGAKLDVETANGSVQAEAGGGSEVEIVAVVRAASEERLAAAKVVVERGEGSVLLVRMVWPNGVRKNREGCRFLVRTPGADGVRLKSSNGSVTLTGLGGSADLKTSNGRVEVSGHSGEVSAETSNGRINVQGATGLVRAKSSNGRVRVELADRSAGPVDVKTSNGSVTVVLGPAFSGTVKMKTSNGGVKMKGLENATVVSTGKTNREIVVGGVAVPVSTVTTSNGSIVVEKRSGGGAVEGTKAEAEPGTER